MQTHKSQHSDFFAKSSRDTPYFNVLITCRTFLVQSGEVTFWGQNKFAQVYTVYTGLPPDGNLCYTAK
jgi:hypothetical protein